MEAKFVKYFPGATSKDLLHYIDTIYDNSFEVAVIHISMTLLMIKII